METKGTDSVEVGASPERVYNLLIDLGRVGEISPECRGAEWLDGVSAPHAGARFEGHNKNGELEWSTECRVLRAMPGEEWAFKANVASETPTTWRYRLKRTGDGCSVTISWDAPMLAKPGIEDVMPGRDSQLAANAATSLANLKRLAEA